MKTWLEDNWLNKLDRIDISERLLEAEREITSLSLLPDNIGNFPELYKALFPEKKPLLAIKPHYVPGISFFEAQLNSLSRRSGCRKGCESTYESFIETIYPRLFHNFISIIPLQVESRRRAAYDLVKENLRYKTIRSFEKDYSSQSNKYTKDPDKEKWIEEEYLALSHAVKFNSHDGKRLTGSEQYNWIDSVDPGESTKDLPDREKAFFIYNMKYLEIDDSDLDKLRDKLSNLPNEEFVNISENPSTHIEEILEETLGSYLSDIKDSTIQRGCEEISRKGGSEEQVKNILFDFRKEEICINTDSNYTVTYLGKPGEGYRKKYKCDAFIKGLPSLGDSTSVYVERTICSFRSALYFNLLCKQSKIDKSFFNDTLPEEVYSGLLEHPIYLAGDASFRNPDDEFSDNRITDVNTFEGYIKSTGLPVMAVRAADYTSGLFNSRLGGTLILDGSNNLLLKRRKSSLLTPQQAKAMWKNYYKADVLYLYDHPTETYSDGTPAKTYIPVQVKWVPSRVGKSAQLGHMNADARLLRSLIKPESVGMTVQDRDDLVAQIASLLLYGDYFLVVNSWDRWCYLPLSEDPYKRSYNFRKTTGGKEFVDEFTIPLNNPKGTESVDVKLRIANRLRSDEDGRITLEIFPTGIRQK